MPFLTLIESVANCLTIGSKLAGFGMTPGAVATLVVDIPAYTTSIEAGGTKWLIDVDEAAGS